jgi:hypothetical protein
LGSWHRIGVMSGMDRMLSLPMTIGTATAEPAAM